MTRFLALLITLCLPAMARACPDPVEARVAARIIPAMLQWIGEHSDYDTSGISAPALQFCAGDVTTTMAVEGMIAEPGLRAAYDPATGTIYMTAPWSPIDPEILSTLLHQLVHHVQIQSRDWPCLDATRFEAYQLQDQWLRQQGYSAGFDWTRIFIESRCPNPPAN